MGVPVLLPSPHPGDPGDSGDSGDVLFLPFPSETIGGGYLYFCWCRHYLYSLLEAEAGVPASSIPRHQPASIPPQ